MPFNTFNSVAKLPKKGSNIPSITFSNPSLVTTTTYWVADASYRVFLIEGSDLSNNSTFTTNATLTNWSSNITIYFLCIGAGGAGGMNDINNGGGGGGGGFLDGSANIPGTPGIKNVSFILPSRIANSSGFDTQMYIRNDTSSITYLYAAAGGGGLGGVCRTTNGASGRIPPGTGQVVKKIQGNGGGGGAQLSRSDSTGYYAGNFLNSGANGDVAFNGTNPRSGGGGGSGGAASGTTAGIGSSVSSNSIGIYQRFGSNIFCVGGGGSPNATTQGTDGNGLYGSGGGGSKTSNYIPGQRGAIAIAISMNDVPL
jgi:hypothetical protein